MRPSTPTASAQSDESGLTAEQLGLEVVAGFDDTVVPGSWTPLQVRLAPERPFVGRILVAADLEGGRQIYRRDVEVAAGGAQVHRFLVPGAAGGVQIQIVDEDEQAVTIRPRSSSTNGFLVGVLEGLDPATIPSITPAALGRRAQIVAVEAELLALGPRVLESISTLVVRHQDLMALPEDTRGTVADAVAGGLQLVVSDPTSTDLGLPWTPLSDLSAGFEPNPSAWTTTEAELLGTSTEPGGREYAAIRAGSGRITVVSGLPAQTADAGAWEPLLQPLPMPALSGGIGLVNSLNEAARVVLGSTETADLPSVGLMALFFLAYLVLVGPVNGYILARVNRRELAWVSIPALTIVFAIAAFFGAAGARPGLGSTTNVGWWIDGQGQQISLSAVQSPRQGEHSVRLPGTSWDVTNLGFSARGRITTDADVNVAMQLEALETGLVAGFSPTDLPAPLQVEAAILDGELRLEVTNRTTADLTNVEVRAGSRFVTVAEDLPAGQTLVDTVDLGDELPVLGAFYFQDGGVRFDARGRRIGGREVLASTLAWSAMEPHPGLVWVTAEAPDSAGLAVPTIDGSAPAHRGSLLAVGTTPTTTDDEISPYEAQRDLIADNVNRWQPGPLSMEGPALIRYRLPREGRITSLVFSLDRGEGALEGDFEQPAVEIACHPVETRDADGNLLEVFESCEQPICPEDAVSCQFGEDTEICFADGICEIHQGVGAFQVPPVPDPEFQFGGTLQMWDRIDRQWENVNIGTGLGTTTDVARWMSPLGEILVRSTGDAGPLDISGRGIGATVETTS